MEIIQENLIHELLTNIETSKTIIKQFQEASLERLNYKKNDTSWSFLECLEHLNLYGDFYLPEIKKTIEKNSQMLNFKSEKNANKAFHSGFFGRMFVDMIQVKGGKIKKMKTVKDKIPVSFGLNNLTVITFLAQLDTLKLYLEEIREKEIDIMKVKTAIALTKVIKLRLGDTLRFVVFHIERHVLQAKNTQI